MRFLASLMFLLPLLHAAERCDVPRALARLKRDAIKEMLVRSPGDFTLNRLFVDSQTYEPSTEIERYATLLSEHPDSLDYQYLHARALVGNNTKEALRLYAQILEKDPDYPWVHLSQLEIFRAEGFRDRAKLQASFETFTRVCPSSIAPYFYIDQIPNHELAGREAARLRALLRDSANERDLEAYRVLWNVELQELPNDQETRQIAEDVKRLAPFEKSPLISALMRRGAFLDADRALEVRLAQKSRAPINELRAWEKAHPYPGGNAPPEKLRAHGQARLEESAKLIELAPDNPIGYSERVNALTALEASPEELLRAADKFLDVCRQQERRTNQEIVVANAFVERGIYLDRVPALVEEMVGRFTNDLRSIHSLPQERMMLAYQSVDALETLVHVYEKSGRGEKAHETLREMRELVAANQPPPEVTDRQVLNYYALARGAMWLSTGQLAEHEGRKLDALSAYREVPPPLRAQALTQQKKLWKELGGSEEGWAQWVAAEPSAPEKFGAPAVADSWSRKLAPMSIKDFDGNLWTLDRLKGKTTIAVVWATWCGPCVSELPHFARLAESVKDREDVLAISFNVDENAFVAESFMKKRGFEFPALAAKQFAEDLMGDLAIPRTWIIKDGMIVFEKEGFGGDADKWVEEMLGRLKERGEKGAALRSPTHSLTPLKKWTQPQSLAGPCSFR
jgi:thiol-disulfide isomerase/thioredoxin